MVGTRATAAARKSGRDVSRNARSRASVQRLGEGNHWARGVRPDQFLLRPCRGHRTHAVVVALCCGKERWCSFFLRASNGWFVDCRWRSGTRRASESFGIAPGQISARRCHAHDLLLDCRLLLLMGDLR